jgi:hypothetical protein
MQTPGEMDAARVTHTPSTSRWRFSTGRPKVVDSLGPDRPHNRAMSAVNGGGVEPVFDKVAVWQS